MSGLLRAFRFDLPSSNTDPSRIGLATTQHGAMATCSGADAVRQGIQLLVSTLPGERVMRPTYGCRLRTLVFAPCDGTTMGLAAHYVSEAVELWEGRVRILACEASADAMRAGWLCVRLDYSLLDSGFRDSLEIGLDVSGG